MATTPTVYVICDNNCKIEGMTKEQILTAIAQAVESGEIKDVDAGFITTIKTINGVPLKFYAGSQAGYDELSAEEKINLFAVITNDTTKEGLLNDIKDLKEWKEEIMNGETAVPLANKLKTQVIANEEGSITKAGLYSVYYELDYDGVHFMLPIYDLSKRVVEKKYYYGRNNERQLLAADYNTVKKRIELTIQATQETPTVELSAKMVECRLITEF